MESFFSPIYGCWLEFLAAVVLGVGVDVAQLRNCGKDIDDVSMIELMFFIYKKR